MDAMDNNDQHTYTGSCHCGAVRFAFRSPKIEAGLRCDCSICQRKGAAMTVFAIDPGQIDIHAEPGALGEYQFNTGVAKHYFCTRCGIYTFHQTRKVPGWYRANLGCIEGIEPLQLPVDVVHNRDWK